MVDLNIKPNLSIIVAVAQNYAIGRDNNLLWHISADLKRFKSLTTDHAVIMGRRTYESLPKKPLPKRRNIILTHDADFQPEGVEVAHTLQQAFALVRNEEEAFVIGGANLYQQILPFARRLYVTWVYSDFDADAYFPQIDKSVFRLISQTSKETDDASGLIYNYADYERMPNK